MGTSNLPQGSATHEEYREARDARPVLVFVQEGLEPERRQADFIREVQGWEQGHFTAPFRGADDLHNKVVRAVHDYLLANEAAPLDEEDLVARARGLVPGGRSSGSAELLVAIAGGPFRSILRPAELEGEDLGRFLLAEALTGNDAVLSPAVGTKSSIRGDAFHLEQDQGPGRVSLDETGRILIVQPAVEARDRRMTIPSLIEEAVTERISRAIRFAANALDHVDPVQHVSHVALIAALRDIGYLPWRNRAEQERSPNAATMGLGRNDSVVVQLSPPVRRRAALRHETQALAEDLTVRLRRQLQR